MMMAVVSQVSNPLENPHIRPLNARRDLGAVADLIELCFAETLDADGKRYLRRMRQASRKGSRNWFDAATFQMSITAEGYIWEEDGKIVGNISLIPFSSKGRPIYLIANVAVHPNYRRRGIARALTDAALNWTQNRRVRSVWLQVRDDNLPAVRLYETTGFIERARRTTWTVLPEELKGLTPSGIRIVSQKSRHWKRQKQWLQQNYPDNLFWYWALRRSAFRPGILSSFVNFLTETHIRHWGAEQNGRLLGMLSWKTTHAHADQLWLAAPPENEELVLQALLPHIYWREHSRRPLSIDLPNGRAADTLHAAGFRPSHTLVWMEIEN
jgi:GNAT superfamily N-acetyltransferase